MTLPNAIRSNAVRMRKAVLRRIAALWQYTYRIKFSLGKWSLRYGSIGNTVLLLFLVIISVCLSPSLQDTLERHYNTEGEIERLRELILSTGSALIGAAAIVASLVLFATQINIERMPHGLFRRLSEDQEVAGRILTGIYTGNRCYYFIGIRGSVPIGTDCTYGFMVCVFYTVLHSFAPIDARWFSSIPWSN